MKPNLYNKSFLGMAFLQSITIIAILFGCGGDPEPTLTEIEKVTNLLTDNGGNWQPASSSGVTIDGVDVTTDLFPSFTITFLDNTLTTTGTSPVWLRQDTWRFKDQTAKVIIRGQDNKEITITEISATQLKLTLEWEQTTTDGGRQYSLKGKHEFVLIK